MVNIDGVVYGHYRTNLAGKDLNRKWDSTEK
jgi:murein tripeptide amidase MpaA